jgi:hypothetical protein
MIDRVLVVPGYAGAACGSYRAYRPIGERDVFFVIRSAAN